MGHERGDEGVGKDVAKVEEVQAIMVGVEVSQIRMAIFYVGTSFYDYDYTSILNYIYRVTGTCTGTTGTCSAVHVRTCMYTQKSFNTYVHTRYLYRYNVIS